MRADGAETKYPDSVVARTEAVFGEGVSPEKAVDLILQSVRERADEALREWSAKLEKERVQDFLVPEENLEAAYKTLPAQLKNVMERAAERIRNFHEAQPVQSWKVDDEYGRLGQRVTPLPKVGVYVPGGTAPLPSSLLMSVIPAQVACVEEIVVCSPPEIDHTILAAAYICGITQVFQVGGAQAIAAMAFGTQSVPKVDKIVGAGNIFVNLAKRKVFGFVGLDGLAGPTETMVIADESANAAWVAADLLAQAEHDVLASAILLTPSKGFAKEVQQELEEQIKGLPRAEIIEQAIRNQGGIVITPDIVTAVKAANRYAPEHLCLSCENAEDLAEQVRNAGGIFLGERSFEVLGDYVAGPSHIMPTGGSARFSSPLNVLDFVKITSLIALNDKGSEMLSMDAQLLATAEGLQAHAQAAEFRVAEKSNAD